MRIGLTESLKDASDGHLDSKSYDFQPFYPSSGDRRLSGKMSSPIPYGRYSNE